MTMKEVSIICMKHVNMLTLFCVLSGIMTAKLLPAFLQCFKSLCMSIRCEVCITCGNLQINEEQVVQQLVHLATSDPSWRVKALAIQGMYYTLSFMSFSLAFWGCSSSLFLCPMMHPCCCFFLCALHLMLNLHISVHGDYFQLDRIRFYWFLFVYCLRQYHCIILCIVRYNDGQTTACISAVLHLFVYVNHLWSMHYLWNLEIN